MRGRGTFEERLAPAPSRRLSLSVGLRAARPSDGIAITLPSCGLLPKPRWLL